MNIKTVSDLTNVAATKGMSEQDIQELTLKLKSRATHKFFSNKTVRAFIDGPYWIFYAIFLFFSILPSLILVSTATINGESARGIWLIATLPFILLSLLYLMDAAFYSKTRSILNSLQPISETPSLCEDLLKYMQSPEAESYRQSVLKQGRVLRVFDHAVMKGMFEAHEELSRKEKQRMACVAAHS